MMIGSHMAKAERAACRIRNSAWVQKPGIPPSEAYLYSWLRQLRPPLYAIMTSLFYLDQQVKSESNARSYPRRLPLAIARAEGLYVTDVDGRRFMDCLCGAGALALGHNHPVVIEAIRRHLDAGLPMQTLDLTTLVKHEFVEQLLSTLPAGFAANAKIQFCSPCGTDAVEASLKLVKTATGRSGIWASSGGFHGQTHGSLALMGNHGPKQSVASVMPSVNFIPFPYAYRCPLGQAPCQDCRCGDYVANVLSDPESGMLKPAGLITEVVQGEGGAIPADHNWLRQIRRLTTDEGIPLIFDEVQTGWGRTGKMYAFEHAGVVPDVLLLSKAIGGGLPLAVVVYHRQLDLWKPGAHSGTFRGNQLAMAAGLATLKYLRQHDLPSHAAQMGERFARQIADMLSRYPFVGEIRVNGLMIGIEVVSREECDKLGRPVGDGNLARRIQAECFQRGLILELGGRNSAPASPAAPQRDAGSGRHDLRCTCPGS
jgi:diaminobutyrate-2-oxoglutarate transaminase